MHDLATINKLNAEAFGPAIATYQRSGKNVVGTYAGLSLVSIEVFHGDERGTAEAEYASCREPSSPDENFKLFRAKYEQPNGCFRDQSEELS